MSDKAQEVEQEVIEDTDVVEDIADERVMRIYEASFWLMPSVTSEQAPGVFGDIKDGIEKHGGTPIAEELPKERELAYQIKKMIKGEYVTCTRGHFAWIKFEAEPKAAREVHTWLAAEEVIIRHMLIETVREDTNAPKKFTFADRATEPKRELAAPGVGKIVKKKSDDAVEDDSLSEEELDKTIDELVV